MTLPEPIRDRLARGVEERAAAAADALLAEQNTAAAKAHLDWMQTAAKLLATDDKPAGLAPLYRAGLLGLICVTLLLLAWTLKVGNNAVRLELRVDGLSMTLPDGWDLGDSGGVPATRLRVPEGLASLYVPVLGAQAESPRGFDLNGRGLRVDTLVFSEDAALDLETTVDGVHFFLSRGKVAGRASVANGRLDWFSPGREAAGSETLDSPPNLPEAVEFASAELAGTGAPFALHLDTAEAWRFSGLRVSALRLRRERVPGSNRWGSTVLEGNGQLLDVGREFSVRSGEWLRLQGPDGVLDLTRDGAGLKLLFVGRVDRIEAGPDGLERNLTPSVLEYLSQSKSTALLWGGLLFLWGLAWKLRALW